MSAASRKEGKILKRYAEVGFLLAMCCIGTARCQEIPEAPKPQVSIETPGQRQIRHMDLYGVAAARIGDWITTQQCMHTSTCHEAILPAALAKSGPGLALFEVGSFAGEWYASRKLARRHPKLALVVDGVSMLAISATVGHNAGILGGKSASPVSGTQRFK